MAAKDIEVWPENWAAVSAFGALATQWRVGFSGATGLDYGAVEPVLRLQRVPRVEWPDIFESIRILESEALEVMRKK